jgi:thermostable 8-oxoguanine DNA glycosylase
MDIKWEITSSETKKINEFVKSNNNPFVQTRISRNVKRKGITIDKNSIIRFILMCLLTTQQRSGPNSKVAKFLQNDPLPINIETLSYQNDIESFVKDTLQKSDLIRYINNIATYFTKNFQILQQSNWELIDTLRKELDGNHSYIAERRIADYLNDTFKGLGPKQSRNFLQALGLTMYEIPIDSRITNWLNDFGFPVTLSPKPLQDKGYYHFISDGIRELCNQAGIYPCVLDAAIFSSFDKGRWTEEKTVF